MWRVQRSQVTLTESMRKVSFSRESDGCMKSHRTEAVEALVNAYCSIHSSQTCNWDDGSTALGVFCMNPLSDIMYNSSRMVTLLGTADKHLFKVSTYCQHQSQFPYCPRRWTGKGKRGKEWKPPERQMEVSPLKQGLVSTELESSCGYPDSGVTKTEASGRPSFEAIHHLYQATQHAVHKEYQGWPSRPQTQHRGSHATDNTRDKSPGDCAEHSHNHSTHFMHHRRKWFQKALQRDNKTTFPTSVVLAARLAETCKLKEKKTLVLIQQEGNWINCLFKGTGINNLLWPEGTMGGTDTHTHTHTEVLFLLSSTGARFVFPVLWIRWRG